MLERKVGFEPTTVGSRTGTSLMIRPSAHAHEQSSGEELDAVTHSLSWPIRI